MAPTRVRPEVGDVEAVPENPILTPPNGVKRPLDQAPFLMLDFSLANQPHGSRCIEPRPSLSPDQKMTAIEAARYGRELIEIADLVSQVRQAKGFVD